MKGNVPFFGSLFALPLSNKPKGYQGVYWSDMTKSSMDRKKETERKEIHSQRQETVHKIARRTTTEN